MKKSVIVKLLLLAAFQFSFVQLSAQEPGPISQIFRIKPVLAKIPQFEESLKNHVGWHRQEKDDWIWDCWEFVAGKYSGQYAIVTHGHQWAEFGRERNIADRAQAVQTMLPYVEDLYIWFDRLHPELSAPSMDSTPPPLAGVYMYSVKPEKNDLFLRSAKKVHQALQEAHWGENYMWFETVEGASGLQYSLLVPKAGWEEFESPEKSFLQILGEKVGQSEAEAIAGDFWESIESLESHIVAYRPDLSYRP